MTGITNSRHSWPDEGVTRVPYFVYEDADLYEDEQRLIFRGPIWNYLGLEIEIPTAGDYITMSAIRRSSCCAARMGISAQWSTAAPTRGR